MGKFSIAYGLASIALLPVLLWFAALGAYIHCGPGRAFLNASGGTLVLIALFGFGIPLVLTNHLPSGDKPLAWRYLVIFSAVIGVVFFFAGFLGRRQVFGRQLFPTAVAALIALSIVWGVTHASNCLLVYP